jgi:putative peptide chain release factor H
LKRHEAWLQVSAGHGPAECAWAVLKVVARIQNDAAAGGFDARTLNVEPGPAPGTAQSVLLALAGTKGVDRFIGAWRGTVQWIARSPFRPEHKRKNWFVGVEVLEPPADARFDPQDVRFETMRASGPGGQHVNRTESACESYDAWATESIRQPNSRKPERPAVFSTLIRGPGSCCELVRQDANPTRSPCVPGRATMIARGAQYQCLISSFVPPQSS